MDGKSLNALGLAHRFLAEQVRPGGLYIDATAGRGRDTVLLCRLAGEEGRVLALDIQEEAVASTQALLRTEGLLDRARVILDSHSHLDRYVSPGTADGVVFNLGWLPGGDHSVRTGPETTLPALDKSLAALRPGGFLCLCLYYGGVSGYEERDAVLAWLAALDPAAYTVLTCAFPNRRGDPPFPAFVFKHS